MGSLEYAGHQSQPQDNEWRISGMFTSDSPLLALSHRPIRRGNSSILHQHIQPLETLSFGRELLHTLIAREVQMPDINDA